MAAVAEKLTLAEFQAVYERGERSYEYWCGEAVAKGMPTWLHGRLQVILARLLEESGYEASCEVELRIEAEARPKPDVIATKGEIEDPYPTRAVEVVVEILSSDDRAQYVLEKCEAYKRWGFEFVYVVNPESKQVLRWTGAALELTDRFTELPAARIWEELEKSLRRR